MTFQIPKLCTKNRQIERNNIVKKILIKSHCCTKNYYTQSIEHCTYLHAPSHVQPPELPRNTVGYRSLPPKNTKNTTEPCDSSDLAQIWWKCTEKLPRNAFAQSRTLWLFFFSSALLLHFLSLTLLVSCTDLAKKLLPSPSIMQIRRKKPIAQFFFFSLPRPKLPRVFRVPYQLPPHADLLFSSCTRDRFTARVPFN